MSLVASGHHVRAKITRLKAGDPLILRAQWGKQEITHVVYAMIDQEDDSLIPTSMTRGGGLMTFQVWPITGKVRDMGLYAERCSEDEAVEALAGIVAREVAK
jgi:hypothetical protein